MTFLSQKTGTYTANLYSYSDGDVVDTCIIHVENDAISQIKLQKSFEMITDSDSKIITSQVTDAKGISDYIIKWSVSSDSNDCIYDYSVINSGITQSCLLAPTGNVGTATITATLAADETITASCTVTVKEPEEEKKEEEKQEPEEKEEEKKEESKSPVKQWINTITGFWRKVIK